jgi:uridine phosphorylase
MSEMKKEAHLTGQDLMNMVQLRPQDIGKYAIVPGPRERLDSLMKKIENPVKNFSFMEYTMYTGQYAGTKVTAINGGRFSADTGITTEILCSAKAQYMIRIGSCGALTPDIKIGDLIIVESALRGEGVTPYYVKNDFKTQSDVGLTKDLEEVAKDSGLAIHRGRVWSTDAILRETPEYVGNAVKDGCIAVDMVSSTFLTIAQVYNVKAAAILAVSDNIATGQMGFMDPGYYMAESAITTIALNLVKKLEGK